MRSRHGKPFFGGKKSFPNLGKHFLGAKNEFPTREGISKHRDARPESGEQPPNARKPKNVNTENVCNIFPALAVIESRTHRKKTWKEHELEQD